MEILNFLSKGCGYKLFNDSKNIKNQNEIFLELGGIESRDCKIQVKSMTMKHGNKVIYI